MEFHYSTSNWIERNTKYYNLTLKLDAGKQEYASLTEGGGTESIFGYLEVIG